MKKILKIALSLIVVLLIGYFIYSKYQNTTVLKNVVHENAESVLKIGLHDIKKTIILDAISSPKYYWNSVNFKQGYKEKDTIDEPGKGIDFLPYSLVFYTMKNVKNTLFTTFPIKNSSEFEVYAQKFTTDKNIKIIKGDYSYAIDEKSKMVYAWNSSYLAVAISPKIDYKNYKLIFDDVLLKNKLISDSDNTYLDKLATSKNHITYLNGDGELAINFLDGKAVVEGSLFTENSNSFNSEIKYRALPNASLQLYFDANLTNEAHRILTLKQLEGITFFEKNNIDVATLLSKTNGVFNLAIKGRTTQKDTIVTYEYDDNFNKIAIKSVQENQAPIITMNLGAKNSLYHYLSEQKAIDNNVLKAIPLYTFYAHETANTINFSTVKKALPSEQKTSGYFFSLNTNFSDLQQDIQFPKASKAASLLDKLRINAQQLNTNEIYIEGKLTATNDDINIISQLYFGLKEKDSI
ncbi:hypothetical protein KO500_05160 [Cellulophaga baltica]|uniref:hypothetical protein n=1 Tax=Cellulophaga TaxID=104264 RepID=UPI001C07BF56|nr:MULTISPECIES: hypothetical protein [Cellulophaga]MBU2995809.1 hypothetical protein [Cellulophaga baltica]MDO6767204.1 hypothetical protein [Cellulophaga sp. 1_MG-2023]